MHGASTPWASARECLGSGVAAQPIVGHAVLMPRTFLDCGGSARSGAGDTAAPASRVHASIRSVPEGGRAAWLARQKWEPARGQRRRERGGPGMPTRHEIRIDCAFLVGDRVTWQGFVRDTGNGVSQQESSRKVNDTVGEPPRAAICVSHLHLLYLL
jgi:hypothetical protein